MLPIVKLIVAMDPEHVIAVDGKIPWDLPRDRKLFKELTMGEPVIMGRTTYDTLGKPLPGRMNIVITSRVDQEELIEPGLWMVPSLDEAIKLGRNSSKVVWIIGGGRVYKEAIEFADYIYASMVECLAPPGKTSVHFPLIEPKTWDLISTQEFKGFEFRIYERVIDDDGDQEGWDAARVGAY